MARASEYTLLPLDQWAQILGLSPWEFNGFTFPAPKSNQCREIFRQYQWQGDHLSREEVASAIADAERMIADMALFWPAPHYEVDEVVQYPRPYQRDAYGVAGTWRGEWKSFGLKYHKVISGGVVNRTHIGTIGGADLTKLDLDSDGVYETFQAVITDAAIGSITDEDEIALYFVTANRHGEAIGETWRIRPVRVSISGNTATITGHRTLLTNPVPEFVVAPTDLVVSDATNYVTSVECYRVFTDTTATAALPYQGVAIWKNVPECTQDCTFTVKPLCLGQDQNEQGQVFASFEFPCEATWLGNREPDRVQVNYVAGLPLVNGKMEPEMAKAVTYLSLSLLAKEPCGCDRVNRIFAKYQAPILRFEDNSANAQGYTQGANRFPMTFGAQYAYNRIRHWQHIEAVNI